MGEEGKSHYIVVGEIWSLVALVVVMIFFLSYLSQENLTLEGKNGKEALNSGVTEAKGVYSNLKQFVLDNRKATIISGYCIVTVIIVYLSVRLITLSLRKKRFRIQNEQSRQKIRAYEESIR